jgi:signal transduction histidine kinase
MKPNTFSKMGGPRSTEPGTRTGKQSKIPPFPVTLMGTSGTRLKQSVSMEMTLWQVPDGIVVSDAEGKISLVNAAARQLARHNPVGKPLHLAPTVWGEMFDSHGGRIQGEEWPWMRALRGSTTLGQECHLVRPDGSSYDILFSAVPILAAGEHMLGTCSSLTDITRHKRAEVMLREARLDTERNQMAKHIHDTLSQGLNAIVLQIQAVEDKFPTDLEEARRHLRRAHEVARDSLTETRRSMWRLFNEAPENKDLASAVSLLALRMFANSSINLNLSLPKKKRALSAEIRLELLRICKEALTNIFRHAQPTKVLVELIYKKREVQLIVHDDGKGFNVPPSAKFHDSFGLISMRKGLERLGGTVVVDSRRGRGTRVVALVPVPPDFAHGSAV